MPKDTIITGLNIGTNLIKGLTVLSNSSSQTLEVLAFVSEPVLGVRKGVVVDVDEVSRGIVNVLSKLEEKIGQKIEKVYVNINGSHIVVGFSHETVVASRADKKFTQEDIDRVVDLSTQAFSLPKNKEILDVITREFIIDGEKGIREPRDLEGKMLRAEVLIVCVFSRYLKKITDAVLNANVQIVDIILSPIASARAVLTPQQKELGVCLVDMGTGTTGISIYKEGILVYASVLPVGSYHITQDIAIGLKVDISIAERIKREFGICSLDKTKVEKRGSAENKKLAKGKDITIELSKESSPLVFSKKLLANIIESRVSEIFGLIQKELKQTPFSQPLPSGIVLTGGGVKLNGIVDFAKKELKLPVRIGRPWVHSAPEQGIIQPDWVGLEDDPSLAGVCGLVLIGRDLEQEETIDSDGGILTKILNIIKKILSLFTP